MTVQLQLNEPHHTGRPGAASINNDNLTITQKHRHKYNAFKVLILKQNDLGIRPALTHGHQ